MKEKSKIKWSGHPSGRAHFLETVIVLLWIHYADPLIIEDTDYRFVWVKLHHRRFMFLNCFITTQHNLICSNYAPVTTHMDADKTYKKAYYSSYYSKSKRIKIKKYCNIIILSRPQLYMIHHHVGSLVIIINYSTSWLPQPALRYLQSFFLRQVI